MNMMDVKSIKKLTFIVNTAILVMVLGLMLFFYICKADILVYFSIPTIFVYIFGYFVISKEYLSFYMHLVYCWITVYMGLSTICLGYEYGFHLYSMSMIPIVYYTNYMAYKMGKKRVLTGIFSAAIIGCYLFSTMCVAMNGPIYEQDKLFASFFWITNSLIVFSFLVFYTRYMINSMIASEEKLKEMSYVDKLTGLYNRHYMMEQLEKIVDTGEDSMIALVDVDDFKKINDIYGHNAGDYVLHKLSVMMLSNCTDSVISRWGGEEFLILIKKPLAGYSMMENLRTNVSREKFEFESNDIKVSITIGLAGYDKARSIDKWIQEADDRLYEGKSNGKNKVVG